MSHSVNSIPLPRNWSRQTKSALLHVIALANFAVVRLRGWCADSRLIRARLAAKVERLEAEGAMLKEELHIKDARLGRIPARERPHYPPTERLAILALRAARGWTLAQVGERFLLTAATVASWMQRLDEEGERALVQIHEPVNRFPDFVCVVVQRLRATFPSMGKVRIAQMLARAGLHLGATTVRRMMARQQRLPPPTDASAAIELGRKHKAERTVTARRPHHVWNIDFTVMPTIAC